MEAFDVSIRDEQIRLGQFIKLANLVESGGMGKELIAEGAVSVNGTPDTRRGRRLNHGDVVTVAGTSARVVSTASADTGDGADGDDDDFFDEATANDDFDPEKWRNM
ncbi:RNA-binding S4 domain-containing protein [Corynebacterium ulceribovis]|uniref:RNA-binding S4 domain-containing protein n=1 Tax=Corynebacterium ulceribovis TaxID=487732 RepID=UPI0003769AB1|nr:RNA-binding S4 domain-containing protein [Corynebacterium ulceribovis]